MNTEPLPGVARAFVNRLASRLAQEKHELVQFLIELADFDRLKHGLELGYPSTLGCLVGELGLTESSACRRISAARLLARFPAIARYLIAHQVTLMGLIALKEVLDETNVEAVLERAAGLSEPAVRELVMRMRMDAASRPAVEEVATPDTVTVAVVPPDPSAAALEAGPREVARPVAHAQRDEPSALTLWVGDEFRAELAVVRDLVSHAVPSGKQEEVLLYVLREARKLHERRRYGSQRKPAARAAAPDLDPPSPRQQPEHVPVAVRRAVDERDGRACAFIGAEGRVCGSTWQLELQHVQPRARGGDSTAANLKWFCRSHNLLQAERDFGARTVAARIAAARVATAPEPSPHAADTLSALVHLGFKRRPAESAVALVAGRVPAGSDLQTWIREALRVLTPDHRAPR